MNKINKYFPDLVNILRCFPEKLPGLLQECASEWDECPGIVLGGYWTMEQGRSRLSIPTAMAICT